MSDQQQQIEHVKVAGFIKRSANHEKIKQEEEELKQMLEPSDNNKNTDAEGAEDEDGIVPESAEERSFKKRYGDLRRHSQKQQLDLQKKIDELQEQLESSTREQIKLPKSEEELEAWVNEYPDVAKIVETIAIKKAREQSAELESRVQKINQMAEEAEKKKAEAQLMKLHPDFDEIREQDEFHEWVEKQPKWVQQALYDNETDAISAARAIDLYKADMGISGNRKKDTNKDAARSVMGSKRSQPSERNNDVIYESDVERMSSAEYEKKQDLIIAAIRSGKFVYDKSGHAR
jgi:hypothetical protein